MKIADSNVTMGSARQYYQMGNPAGSKKNGSFLEYVSEGSESSYEFRKQTVNGQGPSESGKLSGSSQMEQDGTIPYDQKTALYGNDPVQKYSNIPEIARGMNQATQMQFSLLNLLMRRLFYAYMQGGGVGGMSSIGNGLFTGGNSLLPGAGGVINQRVVNYEEYEDTTFYAKGRAITEDGRQIDFNIDVLMSRSYMEYTDIPVMQLGNALCDPLVINLDSSYTQVSDQKFRFDLDVDGVTDEISMPGKGSGFLALDLNGDGMINDGSELFGTQSGDGFADLQAYDSDGNGWIDENDEIFDRLKVWCKGENGEDILMSLKEADIGAIFLGAKETEFSMYGMNGGLNGVVRSTGFFLKESGNASTIQHIDLATNSTEDPNRAKYMSDQMNAETGAFGTTTANGMLMVNGLSLSGTSNSTGSTREARQQNLNRQIAREREERTSRTRAARNRRLREERIARQQNRRRELQEEENQRIEERRLERKDFRDEQIEKLLEDRAYSNSGMIL